MQLNCDDWGVHCSFMDRMWICWVPLPTQLLCQNEFHHTQLEHCLNSQESSKLWKILFCNNQIVRFFNNLFVFKSSVEVNGKLCGNLRQAHHRSGSGDSFYSLPLFLFSFSLYNHNLSNSWLACGSGHKPAIKAVIWNLSTIQIRNDNTYKTQVNTR